MKLSKVFAMIFAVAGILLMALTAGLCILNRNAQPKLSQLPPGAAAVSEAFMEALAKGDYAAAQELLYGQPDLGISAAPGSERGAEVWQALRDSFAYQFEGGCYVEGSSIYRNAAVTTLDVASYTEALPGISKDLMGKKVNATEDLTTIYDENNDYLPQVVDAVMQEASAQALASAGTAAYQVKLELLQREGRWWVIADKALLKAISGGLA